MLIVANKNHRDTLQDMFRVSRQTVSNSLLFKKNSLLSRRIRSYAVNTLKCFVYDDIYLPSK